MTNRISITDRHKQHKTDKKLRDLIRKTCNTVIKLEELEGAYEVSVTLVSNDEIKEINSKYRNKNRVTDVLSFPMGENGIYDINPENSRYMLGDIIISLDRAEEQADSFNHSFEREVSYLTAHSMLHLLGYDHMKQSDKKIMRTREKAVMKAMGLEITTEQA